MGKFRRARLKYSSAARHAEPGEQVRMHADGEDRFVKLTVMDSGRGAEHWTRQIHPVVLTRPTGRPD